MRSRAATTFVALVILAAFGRATLAVCAGWSESAAVRAACCAASGCDQGDANDCCAKGEARQHAQPPQPLAPAVAPAFRVVAIGAPPMTAAPSIGRAVSQSQAQQNDTYLLLSVLLV